jgi:translation initiation factor 5B
MRAVSINHFLSVDAIIQAKRELAKKEGRLLTKKQKEEQKAAEIRRQALLASGVHIEGLQRQAGGSAPRKVTYGNRKRDKQAVSVTDSRASTPAPESKPATPPPASPIPPDDVAEAPEAAGSKDGVKDDWDASSEGEAPAQKSVPGVKDDWDASTDEEEEKPPVKAESVTKKPEAKSAGKSFRGKSTCEGYV